jgi:hypothetical protein
MMGSQRGKRAFKAAAATGVMVIVPLAYTGAGYADAAAPASCLGIEASSVSPPGTTDEFPGGMADLLPFLRATFPGVPPGAIVAGFASIHAGSHEACDAASE